MSPVSPGDRQLRTFSGLRRVVATLRGPDGCPWDRVQTHESLRPYLTEEAAEVLAALDEGDATKFCEELGDLLFQVLIHVQLAEERGEFKMSDVMYSLASKLVRRHPHVFASAIADTPAAVIEQWDDLKRRERGGGPALAGIPQSLPSLAYAQAIQRRAARAGFAWENEEQVWEALEEELEELRQAETAEEKRDEFGDAAFALANLARHLDIDAEDALHLASRGFTRLFETMESMIAERGIDLKQADIDTKLALWEEAKAGAGEEVMTTKESVVTPERFDAGMTWEQYVDHIQRNKSKFQFNFDETSVPEQYSKRLRTLAERQDGPAQVLILGEDWCPDVFRGMPVIVRIAQASGLAIRIFPRDDNLDIMSEFLNHGEHQSIPVAVFYTRSHDYIAHWIERPAKAEAELDEMRKLFDGLDREKDIQEMRKRNDDFQKGPMWASWRDATIVEITELLEASVGK